MLTHQTSSYKHFAKLLLLPLLAIFFVCCTKSMYTTTDHPMRNGGTANYRGNKFEFGVPEKPNQIKITMDTGPYKGNVTTIERKDSLAVKMNGKPIYDYFSLKQGPAYKGMNQTLADYLLNNLNSDLGKLEDGVYTIHLENIVVDESGKIVYYDYSGLRKNRTMTDQEYASRLKPAAGVAAGTLVRNSNSEYSADEINSSIQNAVAQNLYKLMASAPDCKPGQKDGVNVASILCNGFDGPQYKVRVYIHNHQLMSYDDYQKVVSK